MKYATPLLDTIGKVTYTGGEIASSWILSFLKTSTVEAAKVGERILVANWIKWFKRGDPIFSNIVFSLTTLTIPFFLGSLAADKLLGSGFKVLKVGGLALKGALIINYDIIGGIFMFCIKKKLFFPHFFALFARLLQCTKSAKTANVEKAIDFTAAIMEEIEKETRLNPES